MVESEQKILEFLRERNEFVSPTEIGLEIGGITKSGLIRHSNWSSPICKRLVIKGLLERSKNGWYRLTQIGVVK